MSRNKFDPVQVEVMWSRMIAILEEQAKTLMRTAFTTIISEAGDLSAGLFDSEGNMIAQANTGTPGHINSMATGVRHFLKRFPKHTLKPGDVLIGNNAYEISGHLLDVTIVTPAFYKDSLIGYFASTCHVRDVGGRPFSSAAESIYEEGLYIPYMKYYREGRLNEDLQAIIEANSRAPYEVRGDLHAQVVANEVAIIRLVEMLEEFELDEIDTIGSEIIRRAELATRKAISALADGVYENEILTDGVDELIKLKCTLTIKGDEIEVDFEGSSPASSKGINVCLNYVHAYVSYALKATITPDIPNNEGTFRPVKVTAPEGSVVNASHPMPTAARHLLGHFTPECVLGALYHAIPERAIAESSTVLWNILAYGEDINGNPFSYVAVTTGGMGARPNKDGLSATGFPSGVQGTPVEMIESSSPMVIYEKELRPDSGGSGMYRGGLGQIIRFGVRTEKPWEFPTMFDRMNYPARGVGGGKDGKKAVALLNDSDKLKSKTLYNLKPNDVVTLKLPGGGGFGDPKERDPEKVLDDVIDGYISPETAREDYGITVKQTVNGWEIEGGRE